MKEYNDITLEYMSRLRFHDDELGSIIKGHLLIEYILNKIIRKKCKKSKTILNDTRSYTFAIKLQILESMNLLPEYLCTNISRVNRIRNQLAHNLQVDLEAGDFGFTTTEGKTNSLKALRLRRNPSRQYVKHLCFGTLIQLRNHYHSIFGYFPEYKE
jgi:hypothetical protein